MTKPYTERIQVQHGTDREFIIREFSHETDSSELVWHRDMKTRTVHVLSGKGWKLQKDDELPIELEVGKDYYILKMQYHRILKGENPLVVRIEQ